MKRENLDKLLRGGHINMEDRISTGDWPHSPLKIDDLLLYVVEALNNDGFFPTPWVPTPNGQSIRETGVITKESLNTYVFNAQRAQPIEPTVLAEETHRKFHTAQEAAAYYLRWELGLPGDLDGWKVID